MDSLFDKDFFKIVMKEKRQLIIRLYFTGMRLSELINIKTSDIDKVNSQIKILVRNKEINSITFNTLKDLCYQFL